MLAGSGPLIAAYWGKSANWEKKMKRSRDGVASFPHTTLALGVALGGALATMGCEQGAWQEGESSENVDTVDEALRGGTVVTGAVGVVDYVTPVGRCTGSMISSNVILTAAHCFDDLGAETKSGDSTTLTVHYYDPSAGRREVFSGAATWARYPTYDGEPSGAPKANDDIAIIAIPGRFKDTSYRDFEGFDLNRSEGSDEKNHGHCRGRFDLWCGRDGIRR